MQRARTPDVPEEALSLWYELGRLYSSAAGSGQRAIKLGLTVVCVAAALVLLSAPLFGTAWAGPFAPAIPVLVGLLFGGGLFATERSKFARRGGVLRRELSGMGYDARRPTRDGLAAYYDAQLILLRSEYEILRLRSGLRAREAARLLEDAFGFVPEDHFETGPLNVVPDTGDARLLRERWEKRLQARRQRGITPPAVGLREDRAYRVFPREMTVPVELATRRAYLDISRGLLVERYGRDPRKKARFMTEALRRRVERDLGEHAALTRR